MSQIIGIAGKMLDATTVSTGNSYNVAHLHSNRTFHLVVTGTGAVTATANVQASNDDVNWMTVGTLSVNGASPQQDGLVIDANWTNMRIDLTALTGTSARAVVNFGA